MTLPTIELTSSCLAERTEAARPVIAGTASEMRLCLAAIPEATRPVMLGSSSDTALSRRSFLAATPSPTRSVTCGRALETTSLTRELTRSSLAEMIEPARPVIAGIASEIKLCLAAMPDASRPLTEGRRPVTEGRISDAALPTSSPLAAIAEATRPV
ncbi:hypothetical protein BDZ85DRAFT_257134, partial [Elsinoe ampelina]